MIEEELRVRRERLRARRKNKQQRRMMNDKQIELIRTLTKIQKAE